MEAHVGELRNICNNSPVFSGDTLSHKTANNLVKLGLADRDHNGYFIPTEIGKHLDMKIDCSSVEFDTTLKSIN